MWFSSTHTLIHRFSSSSEMKKSRYVIWLLLLVLVSILQHESFSRDQRALRIIVMQGLYGYGCGFVQLEETSSLHSKELISKVHAGAFFERKLKTNYLSKICLMTIIWARLSLLSYANRHSKCWNKFTVLLQILGHNKESHWTRIYLQMLQWMR